MPKVSDGHFTPTIALMQSRVSSYMFEHIVTRNTPAWFKFFRLFRQGLAGMSRAIAEKVEPATAKHVSCENLTPEVARMHVAV